MSNASAWMILDHHPRLQQYALADLWLHCCSKCPMSLNEHACQSLLLLPL